MMMQQAVIESKAGVQEQVTVLIELAEAGVRSGEAAHTMGRSLFQQLLKLGHMLLSLYFHFRAMATLEPQYQWWMAMKRADWRSPERVAISRHLASMSLRDAYRAVVNVNVLNTHHWMLACSCRRASSPILLQDCSQSLAVEMS